MSGRQVTLLVVLVTGLVAALMRLPWLANSPPGFSPAEARTALDARALSAGDLLHSRSGALDNQQPLFGALVWLTSSLTGWGVTGPRLAAALLGIVAAVGCALWYRRALGPWAGIAGGFLVATTFPWLVISRQAQPAIGAAAFAALGLWCLWEGLGSNDLDRKRPTQAGCWIIASGIMFGLGIDSHPAFLPALAIVPLSAAFVIWRGPDRQKTTPGYRWLIAASAALLLCASPVIIDCLSNSGTIQQRMEQDWDADGQIETLAAPITVVRGYGKTLLAIGWNGHDAATLGTPGRGLFDPLLLIGSIAGLAVVFARPLAPLHGVALIWLTGFGVLPALLDPGNPALLMPLTPILFLLPLLGLRAAWQLVQSRGQTVTRLAVTLAAVGIAASAGWSLVRYAEWTRSDTTYFVFRADLREALAAVDRLAPGASPIYIATRSSTANPVLDYLGPSGSGNGGPRAPDPVQRAIDSQAILVVPADGIGYLITTATEPLAPGLQGYLDGQLPVETGTTPNDTIAWQIWTSGQAIRDRLPWTLPALAFADGFELAGFDIRPDLGEVATTGRLPDPPRVIVTLVWDVPRGATAHIARVRILPVETASGLPEESATTAETSLTASPPIEAGNRGREIVIVQLSVPVPESPDLIVEVQAGLTRRDGTVVPPTNAGANAAGDYVLLNRVQYVADGSTRP